MIDDLATFSARLPSWTGSDGLPLSYRHFRYGMDWIHRDANRRALQTANAMRAAGAVEKDWIAWRREMTEDGG